MKLEHLLILETETIRTAMTRMVEEHVGIVFIVSADQRLLGTVTDGDVRRALVSGKNIDDSLSTVANRKPVFIREGTSEEEVKKLLRAFDKQHVPVLTEEGKIVGVRSLDELIQARWLSNYAIIMAGGFGTRMRPFTEKVPKPMLEVAGKPILEQIVERFVESGIHKFGMLLHYKPEMIEEHFKAKRYGDEAVAFIRETVPLGTAGGIRMFKDRLHEPFFVMNGDSLIGCDWADFLEAHESQKASITIGVSEYRVQIPYGVLQVEGDWVVGVEEKPHKKWLTICSVYCVSPEALELLPNEGPFTMPDLVSKVLEKGGRVAYYPLHNITRLEDLAPSHRKLWEEKYQVKS